MTEYLFSTGANSSETEAIDIVTATLMNLNTDQRRRVIGFVADREGILDGLRRDS